MRITDRSKFIDHHNNKHENATHVSDVPESQMSRLEEFCGENQIAITQRYPYYPEDMSEIYYSMILIGVTEEHKMLIRLSFS